LHRAFSYYYINTTALFSHASSPHISIRAVETGAALREWSNKTIIKIFCGKWHRVCITAGAKKCPNAVKLSQLLNFAFLSETSNSFAVKTAARIKHNQICLSNMLQRDESQPEHDH
jgi:hypothetical protein